MTNPSAVALKPFIFIHYFFFLQSVIMRNSIFLLSLHDAGWLERVRATIANDKWLSQWKRRKNRRRFHSMRSIGCGFFDRCTYWTCVAARRRVIMIDWWFVPTLQCDKMDEFPSPSLSLSGGEHRRLLSNVQTNQIAIGEHMSLERSTERIKPNT